MNQLLNSYKNTRYVLVVVAQLAERSLPILEVRGSNTDTGKFYRTFIYCQLYRFEKTKIKEKEAGNGPFFKKTLNLVTTSLADICLLINVTRIFQKL